MSTLESFYPRPNKNRNHETLDPKEKVEMFMCKKRMTFLLQIFYQWRSISKLGLNNYTDRSGNSGSVSHRQVYPNGSQPLYSGRSNNPDIQPQHYMPLPNTYINKGHRNNFSESNFFTFNKTVKQWHMAQNALYKVTVNKMSKEQSLITRFKFSQWYKNSLFMKVLEL